ncbi:WD40 repeat domain-containing serine/threonine-protein kinase [Limnofasciculus baicalensis]|uniref:Serine/threonine protein kinase n=1 Tax=Limnofasciculus baicalensis BBK-W-15 TaxID=2699891 RepID=A0AAE3KQ52_9CYAN|nr:WD40 repeat domain-containing serine/threonine-protein kinase [Limnofasciculus baicalensis]MCP2732180.1 serine/threonine protein kinase [Limnofasciculus baicalensis BBK-W-15]
MTYCLNPDCDRADNPDEARFCYNCGARLLLRERYRAVKLIGQGGFGRTFLAVDGDKPSVPQCVIKQFFPQFKGTNNREKAAELFEQEAVRLEVLGKHSQIPELLAHFTQDRRQYLVQEFIDGQNLAEVLEIEGAFRESQIIDLLSSLLPVLDFIHSHNIIHRDIKPENIIRRSFASLEKGECTIKTRLVIVDFGAAKSVIATVITHKGTSIGTPEFIAPEQVKGKAVYASDLYSLGVTAIHLLTHVDPVRLFDTGENIWVWRNYLVNNPVSDELGYILDKLLQHATNRRYQSAADVLQDLERNGTADIRMGKILPLTSHPLPLTFNLLPTKTGSYTQITKLSPPLRKISLNWQVIHTLKGHFGSVESIAISPDGEILASGSTDRKIKLWHLLDRREICTLTGHNDRVSAVVFSPDGKVIVSGSYDQNIKLWQVEKQEEILTIKGNSKWITCLAISPDGETLVSGSSDGTIKLWNSLAGKELRTIKGHNEHINAMAISSDGGILASVSGDGTVKLWDFQTGAEIHTFGDGLLRLGFFCSVAFSPDGRILATGKIDGTIHLWDLVEMREFLMLKGHKNRVRTLAFSPDGEIFASGSMDRTIKIWQVGYREAIASFTDHLQEVYTVAFSPDGRMLVSGSMDKTIKIWG